MNDEMISVIEAGRQLERRKATIFEVMKRLGIHAQKRRDSDNGNQVVSYLTHADFIRVKQELIERGSDNSEEGEGDNGDAFISAGRSNTC